MVELGKLLLALGLGIAAVGLLLAYGPTLPLLGRLPGDVRIERPGGSFFFPITSSLLVSVVVSVVLWLVSRLRG